MTVKTLLATGGWALGDAQAAHRENPKTFWLPEKKQLDALVPGTTARLLFRMADLADQVRDGIDPWTAKKKPNLVEVTERMWVWVESRAGDEMVGVLMNRPLATHTRLVPGSRVRFTAADVIDLDLEPSVTMAEEEAAMTRMGSPWLPVEASLKAEDANRLPSLPKAQLDACAKHQVLPHPPWVFAKALVAQNAVRGTFPIYAQRYDPRRDRQDSGWSVWVGPLDMGEAAKANPVELISIGDLIRRLPDLRPFLSMPPGWAVILGPDGYVDVYSADDVT